MSGEAWPGARQSISELDGVAQPMLRYRIDNVSYGGQIGLRPIRVTDNFGVPTSQWARVRRTGLTSEG